MQNLKTSFIFGEFIRRNKVRDGKEINAIAIDCVLHCSCGKSWKVPAGKRSYQITACKKCTDKQRQGKRMGGIPTPDKEGKLNYTKRQLYSGYKFSAKRRAYSFSLSLEQFLNIVILPCYWCGDSLTNTIRPAKTSWSGNLGETEIKYTGIDRMDNSKGYELDNCIPCCATCNRMKLNYSSDFFLSKIKQILRRHPHE